MSPPSYRLGSLEARRFGTWYFSGFLAFLASKVEDQGGGRPQSFDRVNLNLSLVFFPEHLCGMRHLSKLLLLSVLLFFLSEQLCPADMREPWQGGPGQSQPQKKIETSPVKLALYGYLAIYSNYITLADGARCPMYPTDAAYSRLAISKHGFLMGIILTVDRLLHEADEQKRSPVIMKYGVARFYDPVEANDFWWYRSVNKK